MELYIIESIKDYSHYVGISKNPKTRLIEHNSGKVRSTRNKIPWVIIYKEEHLDIKSARAREKYLKSYSGVKEKRDIIKKYTKKK